MSNVATLPNTQLQAEQRPSSNGMLNPRNIAEALQIAEVMSRSNIVPKDYQGNPGNIVVAIQWGMELGLPPLQAMQNLAVINGRPSLWGDAVLALVRGSGLLEYMTEDISDDAATCTLKRKNEPEESRTFTKEDAKRAGLLGKQGPWTQYPKRMMQMRARSWAIRDIFPDVIKGIAIAEEAQDIPAERDMGPAKVVPEVAPTTRTEGVKAKLASRRKAAEPPPEVDPTPIIEQMQEAQSLADLEALVDTAKLLTGDARKQAAMAYKVRKQELEATAQPAMSEAVQSVLADIINPATDEDTIADIQAWATDAEMTDAERKQVNDALAARRAG